MSGGGSLRHAGVISLGIKVASVGLGLFAAMIMARMLGPSIYGEYAYFFALITIVAIPAQLGLPNLVVRETARAKADEDPARILGVWGWAHRVVMLVSLVAIVLMLLFILVFPPQDLRLSTLFWALPLVPLIALGNIRGAALRGLGKVNLGQLPEMVLRPALFLLGLALSWLIFGTGGLGATGTMQLQGVASMMAFALGSLWLLRNRPYVEKAVPISPERKRGWLKASIVLGLVAGLTSLNSNADLVMLGLFRGNTEVGVYKIAATVGASSSFVLMSLNVVVMPRIVTLLKQGENRELQRIVYITAQISFATALAVMIVLMVFGVFLLHFFFGDEFVAAYHPLLILAAGHVINAFFGPVALLLNMAGHEKETLNGVLFGAIINLVANLALIPIWGASGAAAATTLSLLSWNGFLYFRTKSKLQIDSCAIWIFQQK